MRRIHGLGERRCRSPPAHRLGTLRASQRKGCAAKGNCTETRHNQQQKKDLQLSTGVALFWGEIALPCVWALGDRLLLSSNLSVPCRPATSQHELPVPVDRRILHGEQAICRHMTEETSPQRAWKMADQQQQPPELEIKSDEDWKSRVKAEDAKLDEELKSKSSTDETSGEGSEQGDVSDSQEEPPAIDPPQFPPPEFATMVHMFSTQAMVALGLIPSPVDGKADQQLSLAKHFIDLLGVLEEKTQGNLADNEKSLLDNSLHELRMAYVELSRQK